MTLAEDLVTAARSVLCPDEDRPYYTERQLAGIERDSCAVVVAVLKRLATYRGDGPPVQWDFYARPDLVRLADEIEGGSRG